MEHGNEPDAGGVRALVYTRGIPGTDTHRGQEEVCRRFAQAWGWQVVALYRDDWRPGTGLATAIKEASEHRASVVIVNSLGSLGDPFEACRLIGALSASGMGVAEARSTEPFVPDELGDAKVVTLVRRSTAHPRPRHPRRRRTPSPLGNAR